eukprot:3687774-Rhodomonas_salina.1
MTSWTHRTVTVEKTTIHTIGIFRNHGNSYRSTAETRSLRRCVTVFHWPGHVKNVKMSGRVTELRF